MSTLKLSGGERIISIGRTRNMSLNMGRRIINIARAAGRHQSDRAAVTAAIIQMARDIYHDHLGDAAVDKIRKAARKTNQSRTMSDTWLEMVWPAGTDM